MSLNIFIYSNIIDFNLYTYQYASLYLFIFYIIIFIILFYFNK